MTKEKQHITEGDFKRYLDNKMTNAERNTFEKALQTNPFEAEALEGFGNFHTSNIASDLQELKSKIQNKKRTKRIPYFAAAATILLLITAGVIWIQLDKQNPLPKTTEVKHETKIQPKQESDHAELKIEELVLKTEVQKPQQATTEKRKIKEENIAPLKSTNKEQNIEDTVQAKDDEIRTIQTSKKREKKSVTENMESMESVVRAVPVYRQIAAIPQNNIISGRVVSADDQMPIPGATIIEKGTTNGNVTDINGYFQLQLEKDSNPTVVASFVGMETNEFQPTNDSNVIQLKPDEVALSEVVIVGFGKQQKRAVVGSQSTISDSSKNIEALPVGGMKAYNKYLEKEAILPPEYAKNKVSIKLILSMNRNGGIDSIDYDGPHSELFKQTKKIILEGPDWNPKYENGQEVNSQVNMKIVFRKEKQ